MSSEIKVIDKAFQILNSFSEAQNSMSLKEIAKITSQNKSTIIRICRSLIKHNFLIKNELTGNYQLGPGAWKMGQIYNANFDIANEIREILKDISLSKTITYERVAVDLHTGRLIGIVGITLVDLVTIGLIILLVAVQFAPSVPVATTDSPSTNVVVT